MINLPSNGDKVRIWPYPGRRVQIDERAVNHEQGGRFAADEGQLVTWSDYHLEAYKSGDFLLHDPYPQRDPEPALEEHKPEADLEEQQPLPLAAPKGPKRSKEQG